MASVDRITSSATSWKRLPVCVSRARWQTLQLTCTRYDITSPSLFGTLRVDAIPTSTYSSSTYTLDDLRTVGTYSTYKYRASRFNMEHGRSPPPIALTPMSPAKASAVRRCRIEVGGLF